VVSCRRVQDHDLLQPGHIYFREGRG